MSKVVHMVLEEEHWRVVFELVETLRNLGVSKDISTSYSLLSDNRLWRTIDE